MLFGFFRSAQLKLHGTTSQSSPIANAHSPHFLLLANLLLWLIAIPQLCYVQTCFASVLLWFGDNQESFGRPVPLL